AAHNGLFVYHGIDRDRPTNVPDPQAAAVAQRFIAVRVAQEVGVDANTARYRAINPFAIRFAFRDELRKSVPRTVYAGFLEMIDAQERCLGLALVCLFQVCLFQVCLFQVWPVPGVPVCLFQVCLFQVCLFQVCLFQVCLFQVCLFQVCLFQVCLFQCGLFQVCLFQVCLFQVCLFQVCLFQVCLFQVCPGVPVPGVACFQVCLFQVCLFQCACPVQLCACSRCLPGVPVQVWPVSRCACSRCACQVCFQVCLFQVCLFQVVPVPGVPVPGVPVPCSRCGLFQVCLFQVCLFQVCLFQVYIHSTSVHSEPVQAGQEVSQIGRQREAASSGPDSDSVIFGLGDRGNSDGRFDVVLTQVGGSGGGTTGVTGQPEVPAIGEFEQQQHLEQAKSAACAENVDNMAEQRRNQGKRLRYGEIVQLRHQFTGKYIHVNTNQTSQCDKNNMLLSLHEYNSKECAVPNTAAIQRWPVRSSCSTRNSKAYVVAEGLPSSHPARLTSSTARTLHPSTSAVTYWQIESEKTILNGDILTWDQQFRFRHASTRKYLCVRNDSQG
uniref:MIR domain-containing protein n=1 Tax=Macrostomum lignano TaxID=282301 RepID=A0A1I8FJ73_9PLAT